jgi:hypothetical protein
MRPFDIALYTVLGVAAVALIWLGANSQRKTSGTADFLATWLATALLIFLVGGGLMMFGVVVVYFLLGQQAAQIGLVAVAVVLLVEPFAVAGLLYRRRRAPAHQRTPSR